MVLVVDEAVRLGRGVGVAVWLVDGFVFSVSDI
jgi:hypothetical protein